MAVTLWIAGRTDVGRMRPKNEDAFLALDLTGGGVSSAPRWSGSLKLGPRGALVAVSDGMGGAKAGEVASSLVLSSLAQELVHASEAMSSQAQINQAVQGANHSVWTEACARGIEMGATLTALYVRGPRAYVAEVGDSRAYLLRDSRLTRLTKDQSLVQMLVDKGSVGPEDAHELPFRNLILQAMGTKQGVKVALGRLELRRRDLLLLCSDGLTNEVHDDEIRDVVLAAKDLGAACERLIDRANEHGGRDNATALLVGVGGDLPPASRAEPIERTYRVLQAFDQ